MQSCQELVILLAVKLFIPSVLDPYAVLKQFSGHADAQSGGASATNQRAHLMCLLYWIVFGRKTQNLDQHSYHMTMHVTYCDTLSRKIPKALGFRLHDSLLMPGTT